MPLDDRQPDDRSRPKIRYTSIRARTSGRPVPTGRPAAHEPPDYRSPADVWYLVVSSCGLRPMYPFTYPFVALDYIYSSTSS